MTMEPLFTVENPGVSAAELAEQERVAWRDRLRQQGRDRSARCRRTDPLPDAIVIPDD